MCNNTSVLGAGLFLKRAAIKVGISISICTKPSVLALLHIEISSLKPDCFRKACYTALMPGSLGGMGTAGIQAEKHCEDGVSETSIFRKQMFAGGWC